ncbi:MAG: hypothetical protein ACMV14_01165 [Prevotella sp.]
MKKTILIFSLILASLSSTYAQENKVFNHVGLGLGVGTTGITIDVAAPVTKYLDIRAGMDIMPNFKYGTSLNLKISDKDRETANLGGYTIPNSVDVEGKNTSGSFHFMLDLFPFKHSSFHITAGGYIGNDKIINVYNKYDKDLAEVVEYNNNVATNPQAQSLGLKQIGVQLGDYLLSPYQTAEGGHVEANIKVTKFRPYLGIGFGRAVPQKHRLALQFDLGAQFWGSPKIYMIGLNGEKELTEKDADGNDGGAIKTLSKITVYPCMTLRLNGRIF